MLTSAGLPASGRHWCMERTHRPPTPKISAPKPVPATCSRRVAGGLLGVGSKCCDPRAAAGSRRHGSWREPRSEVSRCQPQNRSAGCVRSTTRSQPRRPHPLRPMQWEDENEPQRRDEHREGKLQGRRSEGHGTVTPWRAGINHRIPLCSSRLCGPCAGFHCIVPAWSYLFRAGSAHGP